MLCIGILGSVAMVWYLKSFQVKTITYSQIFVSFSAVVSTSLGVIFLHESLTLVKIMGIVLILAAIIFLNFKNASLEKNHLFGLLAGICFGISYTIDKLIVTQTSPLLYLVSAFYLVSLFGIISDPKTFVNEFKSAKIVVYKNIFISGICYTLYNILTFSAYSVGGEVGKIDAINNTNVFFVILFEVFILKNLTGLKRKILASLLAVLGIYFLSKN